MKPHTEDRPSRETEDPTRPRKRGRRLGRNGPLRGPLSGLPVVVPLGAGRFTRRERDDGRGE